MTLLAKDRFTVWYARYLRSNGRKATGGDLAVSFKHRGFQTDSGHCYVVGGRGIYAYLKAVWNRLTALGMHNEAHDVAQAFTNANGQYAWL